MTMQVCSPITSAVVVLFFVAPLAAGAQPAGAVHRIGFLGNSTAAIEAHLVGPFREGFPHRGVARPEGGADRDRRDTRLPRRQEGDNVGPLVMVAVGDPVATGLVASLARPGGNITGLTSTAEETEGKRLELLRQVMPTLSHVAVLSNPENLSGLALFREMRAAAQVLGVKVRVLEARAPGDLDETLKAIVRERPGALFVVGDRLFLHNRQRIMDFATKQRLPVVPVHPELVEAGGLMSFGPSYPGMHRRAAYFVDRILKGAKPAELPVERPTKFELVINLKAAKALGLKIPPLLLQRADQVLE